MTGNVQLYLADGESLERFLHRMGAHIVGWGCGVKGWAHGD